MFSSIFRKTLKSYLLQAPLCSLPNSSSITSKSPITTFFEKCDYKHWVIIMKLSGISQKEKVQTYLQTLARVVGSYKEAKEKMYACSTNEKSYCGFHAEITEEQSKEFEGIEGVVCVLPDSYIDPINKTYGGDKYKNGILIHRARPAQTQASTCTNSGLDQHKRTWNNLKLMKDLDMEKVVSDIVGKLKEV